jgi:hypothetical protein
MSCAYHLSVRYLAQLECLVRRIHRISDVLSLSACGVSNNSKGLLYVELLPRKAIIFPAQVSQAEFSQISMPFSRGL